MKASAFATFAPEVVSQVRNYGKLMRVDKPIGTWLLMWPTLWALWLAGEGTPDQGLFLVFMAGVFVMRSAGCVLNDLADRKIDPYVERTRTRPIASGAVGASFAIVMAVTDPKAPSPPRIDKRGAPSARRTPDSPPSRAFAPGPGN